MQTGCKQFSIVSHAVMPYPPVRFAGAIAPVQKVALP